jgi:hypothetical protein
VIIEGSLIIQSKLVLCLVMSCVQLQLWLFFSSYFVPPLDILGEEEYENQDIRNDCADGKEEVQENTRPSNREVFLLWRYYLCPSLSAACMIKFSVLFKIRKLSVLLFHSTFFAEKILFPYFIFIIHLFKTRKNKKFCLRLLVKMVCFLSGFDCFAF